ncbi:MAG TPA: methyltransferase domain-containing protein [Herpetosiphonaceae bacterium]
MPTLRAAWTRHLDGQHQHPHGLLGRLVGARMARQHAPETAWTIDRLALRPGDRILDLGCGMGRGLAQAMRRSPAGYGIGLDRSPTMARAARRTTAPWRRAGQAAIVRGDLTALPLAPASLDKIYSIHTFYFWPDPVALFQRLFALLAPGGALMVTLSTGMQQPDGSWRLSPLQEKIEQQILPILRQTPAAQVVWEAGPPSRQYNNWAVIMERSV